MATTATFADRVYFTTPTTGAVANITVGAAMPGFRMPAEAGLTNQVVSYAIEDGASAYEVGRGTLSSNGTVMSRTPIVSSNGGARISLSGSARVLLTPIKNDLDEIAAHADRTDNPHGVTKAQVGLGNVDNTSDLAKPISTATQAALNAKLNADDPLFTGTLTGTTFTAPLITADQHDYQPDAADPQSIWLISSDAPRNITGINTGLGRFLYLQNVGTFPITLVHQSTASTATLRFNFPNAQNFPIQAGDGVLLIRVGSPARWRQFASFLPPELQSHLANVSNPHAVTKAQVGLGNVDNTSDASKPISTATQNALDGKQPLDADLTAIAALAPANNTIMQRKAGAWTGSTPATVKTDLALVKADVGLGNVDNTTDLAKPISTATQTALNGKANTVHTHVIGDVTGLQAALDGKADDSDLSGYQPLDSDLTAIAALAPANNTIMQRKAGAWTASTPATVKTDLALVKADVGLGNVDNTTDLAKPISTATQTALNGKANTVHTHVIGDVTGLQAALDGKADDSDLSGYQPLDSDLTAIAALAPTNNTIMQRKAGAWTASTPATVKTDLVLTKNDVGLGNVDNTSDASKPISTATQNALDGKQPLDADLTAIAALAPANNTIMQRKAGAWTGSTPATVKTDLALVKADVGLGNVDNTTDLAKPISTATQTALNAKADTSALAPLALKDDPTFTGNFNWNSVLTAPTITADQNAYEPDSADQQTIWLIASDKDVNINGIAGQSAGRVIWLNNIGPFNITLVHNSGLAIAGNRLHLGRNIVLGPNDGIALLYASARWRQFMPFAALQSTGATGGYTGVTAFAGGTIASQRAHEQGLVRFTAGGTYQLNGSAGHPVNSWIDLQSTSAGTVNIAAINGDTLEFTPAITTPMLTRRLVKVSSTAWTGLQYD